MINNFDIAEKALAVSADSAGSALAENEKVLESVQGRINILKATFQEFATNLIDSSFVKSIITDLTVLLSLLSKIGTVLSTIVSALGGVNAVLAGGGLVTLFSAISAGKFEKILNFFKSIKNIPRLAKELLIPLTFVDALSEIEKMPVVLQGATKTLSNFFDSMQAGNGIMASLSSSIGKTSKAFKGFLAFTGVATVLVAVKALSDHISKVRQEEKELSDEAINSGKSVMDSASSYSGLLAEASTNVEAKARLKEVTLELASALGIEESQLASITNGYGVLTEQLKEATKAKIESNRIDIREQFKNAKEDVISSAMKAGISTKGEDGIVSYRDDKGNIDVDTLKRREEYLNNKLKDLSAAGKEESREYKNAYKSWSDLNETLEEYTSYASEYYQTFAQEAYIDEMFGKIAPTTQKATDNLQRTLIDSIKNNPAWDGTSSELFNAVNSVLNSQDWAQTLTIKPTIELELDEDLGKEDFAGKISEALSAFTNEAGEFDSTTLKEIGTEMELQNKLAEDYTGTLNNQEEAYKSLSSVAQEYGITIEELVSYLNDLGEISDFVEGSAAKSATRFSELSQQMTETKNATTVFEDALGQIEEDGVMSAETLEKLTSLGYEYADCLEFNGRAMTVNAEKVRELTRAENEETQAAMEQAQAADITAWAEKVSEISELESRYDTLTTAEKVHLDTLYSEASALSNTISQYDLLISQLDYANSGYKAWLDNKDSSSTDSGAIFDSAKEAYEALQEGLKIGKTQTGDYLSAADFLIPDDIQEKGMEAAQKYLKAFTSIFDSDSEGIERFSKFFKTTVEKGLATDDNGQWSLAEKMDLDTFAEKLNWTKDMVLAVIGELNEYEGFDIKFADPTEIVTATQNYLDAVHEFRENSAFGDLDITNFGTALSLLKDYGAELDRLKGSGEESSQALSQLGTELENLTGISIDELINGDVESTIELWEEAFNKVDGFREILESFDEDTLAEYGITLTAEGIEIDENILKDKKIEIEAEVGKVDDSSIDEVTKKYQKAFAVKNKLQSKKTLIGLSDSEQNDLEKAETTIAKIRDQIDALPDEKKIELGINDEGLEQGVASFTSLAKQYNDAMTELNSLMSKKVNGGSVDTSNIEAAKQKVDKLKASLTEAGKASNIDIKFNSTGLIDLSALQRTIKNNTPDVKVKTTMTVASNAPEVESKVKSLAKSVKGIPRSVSIPIKSNVDTAVTKIKSLTAVLNVLKKGITVPVSVSLKGVGSLAGSVQSKVKATVSAAAKAGAKVSQISKSPGSGKLTTDLNKVVHNHAAGTLSQAYPGGTTGIAYTGTALVGEEGPEMYVSRDNGTWHTIGDNGAEFIHVKKGDIIFNARQTKALLERGFTLSRGRALLGGSAYAGSSSTIMSGGGDYKILMKNTSGSTSSSKSSSNTTKKETKTTEKKADKTATKKETDAIQEKIDELKEKIDDIIRQYEHEIFMAEHHGKSAEEIIQIYKKMQDEVHKYAEEYRKMGLEETSEEIQNLQQQWWNYNDEINELHKKEFEDYLDDAKFFIEEITHGEHSQDQLATAWADVLRGINKELDYYYSLGYDDTDEFVQSLIQSAWEAKDSILEAIQTAVDEANEAVDGIQDVYSTLTDAGKEYAETGYLSVDNLQKILEFGPKYLSFLVNEEGILRLDEQAIQSVLAARTEEMAAETALAYAKQILIATENGEIATLERLTVAEIGSSEATWSAAYSMLGLAEALGTANGISKDFYDNAYSHMKKMQALTNTTIKTISAYYDSVNSESDTTDRKGALEDILDLVMDLIKYEKDQEIEALEEQTKRYKDIIDQKKESLRLTKEENDYQKSLKDKIKEIAKLESQITQLSLDDSREAQAKKKSLEEELAKLQEELSENVADKQLEVTERSLDNELESFEKIQDQKKEEIEASISSTEKLYRLAIDRINNDWEGLYNDVIAYNYDAGNRLEKDIIEKWSLASQAVKEYGSYVEAVAALSAKASSSLSGLSYNFGPYDESELTGSEMYGEVSSNTINQMRANSLAWYTANSSSEQQGYVTANEMIASQMGLVKRNGSWYTPTGSTPIYTLTKDEVAHAVVEKMKANSAAWNATSDKSTRDSLSSANQTLAARLASYLGQSITRDSAGVWWIGTQKLYDKYHTGGVVGAEDIKSNEVLALLEKGEIVLDKQKESALYEIVDFASALSAKLGSAFDQSKVESLFASNSGNPFDNLLLRGLDNSFFGNRGSEVNVQIGEVTAPIYVSQKLGEDDIKSHAKLIGEVSSEYIKEGFNKRGVRSTTGLF